MPCNNKECFDLIGMIIYYAKEKFGKDIDQHTAWEVLFPMLDNSSIHNLVDDTVCDYGEEAGWKKISD